MTEYVQGLGVYHIFGAKKFDVNIFLVLNEKLQGWCNDDDEYLCICRWVYTGPIYNNTADRKEYGYDEIMNSPFVVILFSTAHILKYFEMILI